MAESAPRPDAVAAAEMYSKLSATARGFVAATSPATPHSNTPDYALLRSHCAPDFRISWGPALFVQHSRDLHSPRDLDGFCDHIRGMAARLATWTVQIADVLVDVAERSVVARAAFAMRPDDDDDDDHGRDGGEPVVHDIVFFVRCDAAGEKVVHCCEYVDPFASQRIRERMSRRERDGEAATG